MNEQLQKPIQNLINLIIINSQFDSYALENIVMGHSKQGDKICIEEYARILNLTKLNSFLNQDYICGLIIDENGYIKNKDTEELFLDFFSYKMELLFMDKVKDKNCDKHIYFPFDEPIRSYMFDLYEIFKQIAVTQAQYDYHDVVPYFDNDEAEISFMSKLKRFVIAITKHHLRQGSRIERYTKDLPFMPYAIKALIKTVHGHQVLKENHPQSLEYKLALLSLIRFHKKENYRLFELKMIQWIKNINYNIL